ncbi:MAG: tRNA uridine-5-carboxymethylaminomethyl(34) synthesis GTPase MnmE [Oligoflexales bacterium]|nr:tRNA uridine-5-carboxymethylaminomethyl(34) synthesis GTPase MnmE [Oligoflexales bacterium]
MTRDEEPIVALATGALPSAIALLRISGQTCHALVRTCLRKKGLSLVGQSWPAGQARLLDFVDPAEPEIIVDEIVVVCFKTPHSYTGQDSVELSFHGSSYVVEKALSVLSSIGIRQAEAGEFTRRAFLNGKMDLTTAEGVQALIHSSSQQQWLAAKQLVSGRLKVALTELSTQLIEALAWLEAAIDFPDEEETSRLGRLEIMGKVAIVQNSLIALKNTYRDGKVAAQGLSVVLCGEPNAGKSTMLNRLLNMERSLVTEIPGTTRDYIEESCLIKGRLIRLIDTAGIRSSKDLIEKMGIERSLELANKADLLVFLVPADQAEEAEQKFSAWLKLVQKKNTTAGSSSLSETSTEPSFLSSADSNSERFLKVLTKSDLLPAQISTPPHWISLSCHTDQGLETFKEELARAVEKRTSRVEGNLFIGLERHFEGVKKALQSLDSFKKSWAEGAYEEILAYELRQSAEQLTALIGRIDTDDVLEHIFKSFCIGK